MNHEREAALLREIKQWRTAWLIMFAAFLIVEFFT